MRPDGAGLRDMTNVTNPAKYINVPDEWYSMPVDLKYFKPYITMATLKDEQEYVMSELKRGPDSTQVAHIFYVICKNVPYSGLQLRNSEQNCFHDNFLIFQSIPMMSPSLKSSLRDDSNEW